MRGTFGMEKVNKIEEYTYEQSPFAKSRWIAPTYSVDVAVITRKFTLNANLKGRLYICGLGYFEATVNGQRLTQDKLIPVATDYHTRDLSEATYTATDIRTHRMYYYEYDVKGFLKQGENVLEVTLGGGWYTQRERIAEGKMHYLDRPRLVFTLAFDDMSIYSDGTEKWCESEIRSSNIFIGEVIDYRFRDNAPKPVIFLPHPEESIFSPSIGIPDRIIRTIEPKEIASTDSSHIYDIGENVSALVSISTRAPEGTKYELKFSERLKSDNSLDFITTGSKYMCTSGRPQIMTDVFITDGGARTFMPRFVWHAFRYFEIVGDITDIESITVSVIHADVSVTCEFDSDSEGANFLFDAYIRTQLSNYHASFPSDCPHRERLGYTGDGQICAKAAMMLTDSQELYRKWILDIIDGQDKESGHIQHTAPFQGGGGGPGGWCSAIITVPYAYHKQFGYGEIISRALPAMKKWIDFTIGCMSDGLVVKEREGGWCLGDWCYLPSATLPESFVNTCWFVHSLRLYEELCRDLKIETDAYISEVLQECIRALRKSYPEVRHIGAANVYAAWIGIDSVDACAAYYDNLGSFDTGFLATDILMDLLFKNNYENVAYKLLESRKEGSFLYMKDNGSTTIWEWWRQGQSESHPMFGASCRQLFEGVLGIRQCENSTAYSKVRISPSLPGAMTYARGSILTPKGRISVSLRREGNTVSCDLIIPENIECIIENKECYRYTCTHLN